MPYYERHTVESWAAHHRKEIIIAVALVGTVIAGIVVVQNQNEQLVNPPGTTVPSCPSGAIRASIGNGGFVRDPYGVIITCEFK